MRRYQPSPWRSQNDAEQLPAKYDAGSATADYRKTQSIYAQGQVADAVYFIQKGRVRLTATSDQGKEAVVAILEEGQFFGEGCLNGQPSRTTSATAMIECRVFCTIAPRYVGVSQRRAPSHAQNCGSTEKRYRVPTGIGKWTKFSFPAYCLCGAFACSRHDDHHDVA